MDIFTRIVLPYAVVEEQSSRKVIALLRQRGIDPGQAFWAEVTESGIVIEQSRDAKQIPGECQFRRVGSAA
ncbi:MAG: hypothetical protein U9R69_05695 [Thermodesulfobacteriota bacterium]|nr:hypothetical protein [Thermodesulfobacteriota bacterium]